MYRAWDDRLRVWRAAKVLLPEFARKKKLRRRFEREAHTMARLEHPNLVRVVDVGTSGSLPFIVMELVPCGTLMQWVDRNGPMPEAVAVDAMVQVAEGLQTVHDNGVVHRDIKPHNVLINEQGVCKITDFGIAQESEEGLTRAGSVMGTMGYMAPEQRNDAAGVDRRADVYGFGATMWKLITGRPLRDLFMYTEDESIMEGIDEGLAEVLMACLSYARDDRPEAMTEVIDALRAVRETLPEVPGTTPPLPLMGLVESMEATSDTFAEIGPAFTLSDLSSNSEVDEGSTGSSEAPKSLPGLPYGLPRRLDGPTEVAESTPSWLVEDDHTTDEVIGGGGFDIRPDDGFVLDDAVAPPAEEELAARTYYEAMSQEAPAYLLDEDTDEEPGEQLISTPAPVVRGDAAPAPLPAAELGSPLPVGLLLKVGLVAVFVFVSLLGGLLFWSRSVVLEAAVVAQDSSQRFYATLDSERNVATELVHFDRNAKGLEGLFLDYLDHPREPERWERAMTFIQELNVYAVAAAGEDSAQAKQVQDRVSRLMSARERAVTGRRAWLDAGSSFPGVIAAGIGLAPSAPYDPKALEVQ